MEATGVRERKPWELRGSPEDIPINAQADMPAEVATPDPFSQSETSPEISLGYAREQVMSKSGSGYAPLSLEEEEAKDEDALWKAEAEGKISDEMMKWHDKWLHAVECGELDIYTCLGLSDLRTFGPDTRRVIAKIIGVLVLQMLVPTILLKVELDAGVSFNPKMPGVGFRTMGVCLYLYSLYSMYNNALDECRAQLLEWCIDRNVPSSYWLPLMIGELTNVFVSLILVVTLFVIFCDVEHPADLILNAVAVNFLGAVDGEFVNDVMKEDALTNFKKVFWEYGVGDHGGSRKHQLLSYFLMVMLTIIVVSGLALSVMFFFAPSPVHMETANIGKPGYQKLI